MTQDYIYIQQKLYITALLKIFSILIQILLMVYFMAYLWIIFVEYFEYQDEDNFMNNSSWRLSNHDYLSQQVIILYFSLTSLSTIGLGDYHPITNEERVICTILFLIGVILFSYALGQL